MIIAVDFDGVLCEDEFPKIGVPHYQMISLIRQLIDEEHEVILWTSRYGDLLEEAVEWCEDRGLHFTEINKNAPSNLEKYGTDPRKIFADVYIDDRDIKYFLDGKGSFTAYKSLLSHVEKGVNKWNKEEEN